MTSAARARRMAKLTAVIAGLVAMSTTAMASMAWAQASGTAATISSVGWWTSNPAASAPAGGFAVQAGPNATTISQAAVEITIAADALEKAVLVLTEEGGVQADGAALQVCGTPNAWDPAEKGAAADAPKPECDQGKVLLVRDGAVGTWSGDVRSLLSGAESGDDVSLMIVPAGAGAVPLGFEVRFQKPVLDAVGTPSAASSPSSSSGSSSSSSSGDTDATSSFPSSSPSSSFGTGGSSLPSTGSVAADPLPSFASPSSFVDDSGVEVAAAPPDEAAVAEAIAPPAASPFRAVTPAGSSGGSRRVQALFFVAVAAVVGIAVGFGHARLRNQPAL